MDDRLTRGFASSRTKQVRRGPLQSGIVCIRYRRCCPQLLVFRGGRERQLWRPFQRRRDAASVLADRIGWRCVPSVFPPFSPAAPTTRPLPMGIGIPFFQTRMGSLRTRHVAPLPWRRADALASSVSTSLSSHHPRLGGVSRHATLSPLPHTDPPCHVRRVWMRSIPPPRHKHASPGKTEGNLRTWVAEGACGFEDDIDRGRDGRSQANFRRTKCPRGGTTRQTKKQKEANQPHHGTCRTPTVR
mmetsp:Transcript_2007/g.7484  ORF Transcript_2007/g.7484 Transcript_2007/m.7484 type:complete len:244 (-) Transcript_2007:1411-2142(-)